MAWFKNQKPPAQFAICMGGILALLLVGNLLFF